MKAYVVNLLRSEDRRVYMENLLSAIDDIEIEYINAVDGKSLSDKERYTLFDVEKFSRDNLRLPRPGEIGCTLSHQKCYRRLIESDESYAIVFEDDIVMNEDPVSFIAEIEKWLRTDEPRVLLLSGWFWYTNESGFDEKHKVATVSDGYLTHAYALNRAAAELMTDERPWYVADVWDMFRKRGIRICGLRPHPFDQDWSGVFKTVVNDESHRKTSFNLSGWMKIKKRSAIQKILTLAGSMEPARHNG